MDQVLSLSITLTPSFVFGLRLRLGLLVRWARLSPHEPPGENAGCANHRVSISNWRSYSQIGSKKPESGLGSMRWLVLRCTFHGAKVVSNQIFGCHDKCHGQSARFLCAARHYCCRSRRRWWGYSWASVAAAAADPGAPPSADCLRRFGQKRPTDPEITWWSRSRSTLAPPATDCRTRT